MLNALLRRQKETGNSKVVLIPIFNNYGNFHCIFFSQRRMPALHRAKNYWSIATSSSSSFPCIDAGYHFKLLVVASAVSISSSIVSWESVLEQQQITGLQCTKGAIFRRVPGWCLRERDHSMLDRLIYIYPFVDGGGWSNMRPELIIFHVIRTWRHVNRKILDTH